MISHIRGSFSAGALRLATSTAFINAAAIAALCGGSQSASAAPETTPAAVAACAPLTLAQQHILEAAANGVDALRDHLWMRRGIRGDDLVGTVQWIDAYRLQSAGCGAAVEPVALVVRERPANGALVSAAPSR